MVDLYANPPRTLGDIVTGGTGISTGNDKRFLRRRDEVKDNPQWVPYFKNGARNAYWYEPEWYIEREYKEHAASVSNYLIRNERYFFNEGITCSSVGIRFTAAYMPTGGLFGVNANFFCNDRDTLFYVLGLLNSDLTFFLARRVLNRTNNISANYLRRLPYIEPQSSLKIRISAIVQHIITQLQCNPRYDYSGVQEDLNQKFVEIYRVDDKTLEVIKEFKDRPYDLL